MTRFLQFSASSSQQIHKMHKITSYFYGMRKILTKKFWSQGTSLGSSGSGSWADVRPRACQFQILVIWGPNEPPVLVALQGQAKSLKPFPSRSGAQKRFPRFLPRERVVQVCERCKIYSQCRRMKPANLWHQRTQICVP